MNNQRFGDIPASRFGNISDELEEISKTSMGSHYDMKDHLQDISEKVERSIEVNIQLQQKITKLGEAIASLAKEIKMNNMNSVETQAPQNNLPAGVPPSPILDFIDDEEEKPRQSNEVVKHLKLLTEQNMELVNALRKVDERLDKGSSKEKIEKALRKVGAI